MHVPCGTSTSISISISISIVLVLVLVLVLVCTPMYFKKLSMHDDIISI